MLEKFHLRGGNQDPGDPGARKVRGGNDFFPLRQGGGGGGGLNRDDTMCAKIFKVFWISFLL